VPDQFNINRTIDKTQAVGKDHISTARTVMDLWNEGKRAQRDLEQKIIKGEQRYRNEMKPKNQPWKGCSNVNVPVTSATVDVMRTNITASLLGDDPSFVVQAEGDTPYKTGLVHTAIIKSQFHKLPFFRHVLEHWFHKILLHGSSAIYTEWKEYVVPRPTRMVQQDPVTGELKTVIVPRNTLFSYPQISQLDLFNYIISPNANCVNHGRNSNPAQYVIIERALSITALSDPALYNQSAVARLKQTDNPDLRNDSIRERDKFIGVNNEYKKIKVGNGIFRAFEHWQWIDDRLFMFIVVDNEGEPVLVRQQECPYFHYSIPLIVQNANVEGDIIGTSIPIKVEEPQKELNAIHNQRRDSNTLHLMPLWKVRLGSRFDANQSLFPGAMLGVRDMNDVQPLVNHEQGVVQAYQDEQLANAYLERLTGVNAIVMGQQSPQNINDTATTTVALRSSAMAYLKSIATYWAQSGVKELGNQIVSLNQQFYPIENRIEQKYVPEELEQDLDQGMLQVVLEDMGGSLDFSVKLIPDEVVHNIKRQQVMEGIQVLSALPYVQGNLEIQRSITSKALDVLGIENVTLPSVSEMEQRQQMQARQQIQDQIDQAEFKTDLETEQKLAVQEQKDTAKLNQTLLKNVIEKQGQKK